MRSMIHLGRDKAVCMGVLVMGLMACTRDFSSEHERGLSAAERSRLDALSRNDEAPLLSIDDRTEKALLRQPSRPVHANAAGVGALIEHLERTARRHSAMGIAAVQVGIPVRIALLQRVGGNGSRSFQAFLNPALVHQSASRSASWEHCLSVPWGYRFTSRPREITVRFQDAEGKEAIETLQDDEAIVFQQEMDHLDGKLLSDGQSREAFIPKAQIAGFASAIRRECRGRNSSSLECDELMRVRWEEWSGLKAARDKEL